MSNNPRITIHPLFFILVIVITLGLSIAFSQILASWQAPVSSAPTGNVSEPINASSTGQVKDGPLTVNFMTGAPNGLLVPNGNVGIGTTTPSQKLVVNGDVRFTGIIKGDASGNVTIQLGN
jgi:hypothetical protein